MALGMPILRVLRVLCSAATLVLLVAWPGGASAQDRSRWGVSASVVPRWTFFEPLGQLLEIEADARGTELRIGMVRGRDLSGDWGISFVHKTVEDGSIIQLSETACVASPTEALCPRGAYHVTSGAALRGVELHTFVPFGTMARRVQVGLAVAGGVAQRQGTTERFIEHLEVRDGVPVVVNDAAGPGLFRDILVRDWEVVPLGRAEFAVAWLVAPGAKLRLSGGMSLPGYHVFGAHVHYLFGAR